MTTQTLTSPVTPEQYKAALERANADGINVLSKNTKDFGCGLVEVAFHVYSPKSQSIYHVKVSESGKALICDCEAGNNGQYCKHRARVHKDIQDKVWTL